MGFPVTVDMSGLSDARKKILNGVLDVVPSKWPEERFNKATGGTKIDLEKMWLTRPTYSTCESFLGYIGQLIGQGGWAGMSNVMNKSITKKAWVTPDSGSTPKPGDVYHLGAGRLILHVGIVIDVGDTTWWTADFGQGMTKATAEKFNQEHSVYNSAIGVTIPGTSAVWSQYSSFVKRPYNNGRLKGEGGGMVQIAGWADIDAYLAN